MDLRHLRMGGTPVLPGRTWGEGKGEEKWKREELAPLRLSLGEKRDSQAGRGPPTVGMWRDLGGIIGSKVNTASISPAHSNPRKPTGISDLNFHPLRPPSSCRVPGGKRGKEGRRKEK